MKKIVLSLASILVFTTLFAQAPEKMNYQAVARDTSGTPLVNQIIDLTFDIIQGSATGTLTYSETQTKTTNQFGLFTAEIGAGTVVLGAFPSIAWGANTYYLKITINGDVMPATQLLSVPYALYSKSSGGTAGLTAGNGIDITGGVITATKDTSSTNELQTLSLKPTDKNVILLSNGDSVKLAANAPTLNQVLTWDGIKWDAQNTASDTDWTQGAGVIYNLNNKVGIGTATPGAPLHVNSSINTSTSFIDNGIYLFNPGLNPNNNAFITTRTQSTGGSPAFSLDITNKGGWTMFMDQSDTSLNIGKTPDLTGPKLMTFNFNNENIGIGTTTPNAKLDVEGYTETDSLRVLAGAGTSGKVLTSDALGNATWQTPSALTAGDGINITGSVITATKDTSVNNETIDSLNLIGNSLVITEAGAAKTVDLSSIANVAQTLSLSGDTLYLSGADSVILPPVATSGANITGIGTTTSPIVITENDSNELISSISLTGETLSITEAGAAKTVDLSSISNVNQTLSLLGDTLYLSGADSVILPFSPFNKQSGFTNYIYPSSIGDNLVIGDTTGMANIVAFGSPDDVYIKTSDRATLLVESTGANGNDVGIGLESPSRLWTIKTNRGDQTGGSQGDLFIRDELTNENVMVFDTLGNVGVGTNLPLEKLHVSSGGVKIDRNSTGEIGLNVRNFNALGNFPGTIGGTQGVITTVNSNTTENKIAIQGSAAGGAGNTYGVYGRAKGLSGMNAYGIYGFSEGFTGSTNFGVYGKSTGGGTNWAGYFDEGNVHVKDTLYLPNGAATGKVLTAVDATGKTEWQAPTSSPWSSTGNYMYALTDSIGIGTTTPTAKLHTVGNSIFDGLVSVRDTITTAVAGQGMVLQPKTINAGTAGDMLISSGGRLTGGSGKIVLSTPQGLGGGGYAGNIDIVPGNSNGGAGLGGNVNITAGGASLGNGTGGSVSIEGGYGEGDVNITGGAKRFTGISNSGDVNISTTNSNFNGNSGNLNFTIGTAGTGDFGDFTVKSTSGTEYFTYNADSLAMGIGTATPEATLDVVADGGSILIPRKSTTGDPSGLNGMIYYNELSNKFRVYQNGAWVNWVNTGNGIYSNSGSLSSDILVTQGTHKLAFSSTVVDAFNVDNGTFSVDAANNNVGIGTTTPAHKLHIVEDDEAFAVIQASNNTSNFGANLTLMRTRGTNAVQTQVLNGNRLGKLEFLGRDDLGGFHEGASIRGVADEDFLNSTGNGAHLEFHTADIASSTSEAMRITGGGEVGIGTSSPTSPLHVLNTTATAAGNAVKIDYTTSTNGLGVGMYSLVKSTGTGNITSGYFQVESSAAASNSKAIYAFNTASATTNTGIGAVANGTGTTNIGISASASGATNNWAGYFGSGNVYIQNNIGIGTTTPSVKLDVAGYTKTDSLRVLAGAGTAGNVLVSDANGNATWVGNSKYTQSPALNNASVNSSIAAIAVGPAFNITKDHANSKIEVTFNSRIFSGNFQGATSFVKFEIKIDGASAGFVNLGAISSDASNEFVSMFAVFEGLSAGLHTIQVFTYTNGLGSTSVLLDPGGLGGRMIAKETF